MVKKKCKEKPWDILRLVGQKYHIFQWNKEMDTRGELEQPKGEGFQEDQDSPTLNAAIIKENGYWPLTRKSLDTKHSAYACTGKEESFLSFLEKKKKGN